MRHEVFGKEDGAIVLLVADGMVVEGLKHPELERMDACRMGIAEYGHEFVSEDVNVEQGCARWVYGRLSDH